MPSSWIYALIGGALIGVSVSLMLFFNGRVTGISGILNGALEKLNQDSSWRLSFIVGLLTGGFTLFTLRPDLFTNTLQNSPVITALAGLLVGFGTLLGSGCTSGHGVCGISRFSVRSLLATVIFISAGVLTVILTKSLGGWL